ncbi:MAG: adenosylcobinamide-GDP ribazoletransferase, partial [Oscillospiraceae bacterium]|nr:adenosylcobinamide-GDP ribazoletransferase [Oscillospiraceae bacterium]
KSRVRGILAVTAALCLLGTALAGGWKTLAAVCAVTLPIALHFRQTARKRFGGVSGDLAGWFLVKLEFWLLAALTAVQILEGRG